MFKIFIRDVGDAEELGRLIAHRIRGLGDLGAIPALSGWNENDHGHCCRGTFTFEVEATTRLGAALELDVPLFATKALDVVLRRDRTALAPPAAVVANLRHSPSNSSSKLERTMPAVYRHRKVTLKGSPHIGKMEKWEPLIRDGQYVLAHRFAGPQRHENWNIVLVATLEVAIGLLQTGRYCIRMLGELTGKDALLAPGSLIIEP